VEVAVRSACITEYDPVRVRFAALTEPAPSLLAPVLLLAWGSTGPGLLFALPSIAASP
jgi:hypothetical protein